MTDEEERNIASWKGKVIQLCRENLNRPEVIERMTLNNKVTATALRELNVLKENFAITKVDKLSHNLALICKKLYLHKLYTEINSDAYAAH